MENLNLHWYLPEGWCARPAADAQLFVPTAFLATPETTVVFELVTERVTRPSNRCVVELSVEGRPTAMLVPVVLLNGNATSSAATTGVTSV